MIAQNDLKLPITPSEVATMLSQAYSDYRGIGGWIVRARPYICPFEEILVRIDFTEEILDVGCGLGSLSVLMANCGVGKRVLGIDISPSVITRAGTAKQNGPGEASFAVMRPGVYPAREFNAVVCVDVLHHVPVKEQRVFIKRIGQLVKPGGQLIIKDISPLPRWKAAANRVHDVIMANQWVNYQAEQVVGNWLREDGLIIKEECRLDRWWYGHYLIAAVK